MNQQEIDKFHAMKARGKFLVKLTVFGKTEWAYPENPDHDARLPLSVKWTGDQARAFAFFADDAENLLQQYGKPWPEDPTHKCELIPTA